jgi:hypothetical protein
MVPLHDIRFNVFLLKEPIYGLILRGYNQGHALLVLNRRGMKWRVKAGSEKKKKKKKKE